MGGYHGTAGNLALMALFMAMRSTSMPSSSTRLPCQKKGPYGSMGFWQLGKRTKGQELKKRQLSRLQVWDHASHSKNRSGLVAESLWMHASFPKINLSQTQSRRQLLAKKNLHQKITPWLHPHATSRMPGSCSYSTEFGWLRAVVFCVVWFKGLIKPMAWNQGAVLLSQELMQELKPRP